MNKILISGRIQRERRANTSIINKQVEKIGVLINFVVEPDALEPRKIKFEVAHRQN